MCVFCDVYWKERHVIPFSKKRALKVFLSFENQIKHTILPYISCKNKNIKYCALTQHKISTSICIWTFTPSKTFDFLREWIRRTDRNNSRSNIDSRSNSRLVALIAYTFLHISFWRNDVTTQKSTKVTWSRSSF